MSEELVFGAAAELPGEGDRSRFFFFWGGPFSQWAKYPMEVDGRTYNTCEQFMMAGKARLFGDEAIFEEIMKARDPSVQKKLGRKVANFDSEVWNAHAREIVYQGNLAKFSQHEKLKAVLMDTGDRTIVEASPMDMIWGIGMAEDDPQAPHPHLWQGTNWLGECIQRVRDTLRGG